MNPKTHCRDPDVDFIIQNLTYVPYKYAHKIKRNYAYRVTYAKYVFQKFCLKHQIKSTWTLLGQ